MTGYQLITGHIARAFSKSKQPKTNQKTQANIQLRLKKERKKEDKKNKKLARQRFLLYNVASMDNIMRCRVTPSKNKSFVKNAKLVLEQEV